MVHRLGTVAAGMLAGLALTMALAAYGPAGTSSASNSKPPGTAPLPQSGTGAATTAWVISSGGLIPVDLASGQVGSPIAIVDTANAVVTRGGTLAYVLTVPSGASSTLSPSVVPVGLTTGHTGTPVSFHASKITYSGASASPPAYDLVGLAVTPDANTVVVADAAADTLRVIDMASGRVEPPIPLPREPELHSLIAGLAPSDSIPEAAPIGAVAIDPIGRTAYVADGYVVLAVDLATHKVYPPLLEMDGAGAIAIDPAGRTAYVANPVCWQFVKTLACGPRPARPVAEPNGRIQLCGCGDHVTVVDLKSRTIEKVINLGSETQPTDVVVSPDGSTAYVTHGQWSRRVGQVTVLDTRTNTVAGHIRFRLPNGPEGAYDIAVSPDGSSAVVDEFAVETPGPYSQPVFQGVMPIDLRTRTAGAPIYVAGGSRGVLFGR